MSLRGELGIIDSRFRPPAAATEPGAPSFTGTSTTSTPPSSGCCRWAPRSTQPITAHGEVAFVTAAVVDPFGNVLGVMNNPHYLDVLESIGPA